MGSDLVFRFQRATAVGDHNEISPASCRRRRSQDEGRAVAAYSAHRLTNATLRELRGIFALTHSGRSEPSTPPRREADFTVESPAQRHRYLSEAAHENEKRGLTPTFSPEPEP